MLSTITARALRPDATDYAPYYSTYVGLVPDGDVVSTLEVQLIESLDLFGGLTESQGALRYAPGKWSVRETIGHISDSERVFTYRALRFARGDETPVAGFDQDVFMKNAAFRDRSLASVVEEYAAVRRASLALFASFSPVEWSRRGTANEVAVSVRGLAWITAGHERHHRQILLGRYL